MAARLTESPAQIEDRLNCLADLRNPHSLFLPRRHPRRIIYHSGGPNSGKTYEALQLMLRCQGKAIYCCPLRLLADEVYKKCNDNGKPCDLVTGEEIQFAIAGQESNLVSSTIQMANLDMKYKIAIIDEIQMVDDKQNGWAYTNAVLGLHTNELHLCGDHVAFDIIQRLVEPFGETVTLKRHIRPSVLHFEPQPLHSFQNVRDGDCIVAFTKRDIRHICRQVESLGRNTSKIYGTLPPNVKKQQAIDFNNPNNNTSIMVATNAIGMGLNLEIRRIILYSLTKKVYRNGGYISETISTFEFKQIVGRAGRGGSRYQEGFVTTFDEADYHDAKHLFDETQSRHGLSSIRKVGLMPPIDKIRAFSVLYRTIRERCSLTDILQQYSYRIQYKDEMYFLCDTSSLIACSEKLNSLSFPIEDMYKFCSAPVNINDRFQLNFLFELATVFNNNETVSTEWLDQHLNLSNIDASIDTTDELQDIENIYAALNIYFWLNRIYDHNFPCSQQLIQTRERIEVNIGAAVNRITQLMDFNQMNISRGRRRGSARSRGRSRGQVRGRGRGITGGGGDIPMHLSAHSLSSSGGQSRNCVVCLINEANHVMVPCYHANICGDCVNHIVRTSNSLCPVCRSPFTAHHRIYQ